MAVTRGRHRRRPVDLRHGGGYTDYRRPGEDWRCVAVVAEEETKVEESKENRFIMDCLRTKSETTPKPELQKRRKYFT